MDKTRLVTIKMPGGNGQREARKGTLFGSIGNLLQICKTTTLYFVDKIISVPPRLYLHIYWLIIGRFPSFIDDYMSNKLSVEYRNEIGQLRETITEREETIRQLESEKDTLKDEKQDLLRRLSEAISVRLRDNNPNIVDLNDQCRPTKLAEMFSELYDNEWTSAFTILHESLGEKHTIVVLLDIVMEAHKFCEHKVTTQWEIITSWFLDMELPGTQQTSKWLKDSRKTNIRNKVPEITNDFKRELSKSCQENKVEELLARVEFHHYITKCIELCLLMITTDPPVVPQLPEWRTGVHDNTFQSVADINTENKVEDTQELLQDNTESNESKEREYFDKDMFKEYTTRGQYLDYAVWPALFLHKDGPLLGKGIAQGSDTKNRELENENWTWRKEVVL